MLFYHYCSKSSQQKRQTIPKYLLGEITFYVQIQ